MFITGAAAGIGRSTALKFARSGYLVGAYDIDETGLASLNKAITSTGGRVVTGILDVTDPIRAMILERASIASIKEQARKQGMLTLRMCAVRKLLSGATTVEDVARMLHVPAGALLKAYPVVADGRVTELGTHDELLHARGRYAQLFELQAKGYR